MVEDVIAVTNVIVQINVCVWVNVNVVKSANVNINALAKAGFAIEQFVEENEKNIR